MYTPEDSPFEKFRTEKLKGVAMSPDVLELVAKAYEGGFIDGMQKQMQSSVDRAVNRMAEQPAQQQEPDKYLLEVECTKCGATEKGVLTFTPPASKPWVRLTEEEIDAVDEANWDEDHKAWGIKEFARAIEAKLIERNEQGEKNHG